MHWLEQGLGTFMAKRAMTSSYFKMYFHVSHTIDLTLAWPMFRRANIKHETTPVVIVQNYSGGIHCFAIL